MRLSHQEFLRERINVELVLHGIRTGCLLRRKVDDPQGLLWQMELEEGANDHVKGWLVCLKDAGRAGTVWSHVEIGEFLGYPYPTDITGGTADWWGYSIYLREIQIIGFKVPPGTLVSDDKLRSFADPILHFLRRWYDPSDICEILSEPGDHHSGLIYLLKKYSVEYEEPYWYLKYVVSWIYGGFLGLLFGYMSG